MRKIRISDEIVSLNMYTENDDQGYLTSYRYSCNANIIYDKDRPCYFTKCTYIHYWHRQLLISNDYTRKEIYNRCTGNRPIYNKNII